MISRNDIQMVRSLSQKKFRDREGLFVVEGEKLVAEALACGWDVVKVWYRDDIGEQTMAKISMLTSPSPVLAVVKQKNSPATTEIARLAASFASANKKGAANRYERINRRIDENIDKNIDGRIDEKTCVKTDIKTSVATGVETGVETGVKIDVGTGEKESAPLVLALDSVRDPGNLGTIIRLADWFGIDAVLCTEDTVELYNPKVVQATMGAVFRVKFIRCNLREALCRLSSNGASIYGTFLEGEIIHEADLSDNGVIVMGSESNGISGGLKDVIDRKLFIPPYPIGAVTSESLNVATATAIICSEFRRRR